MSPTYRTPYLRTSSWKPRLMLPSSTPPRRWRADQASSLLPNPSLLARPATRREAVSTSALEGTYAFLADLFEAVFLEAEELTSSVSEVRNYVTAAERAYDMVAEGQPISVRMLEDLERELLRRTASDGSHAGSVRTTQVFIGLGNRRVMSARFVPPPADHRLLDGLRLWPDWIRESSAIPTIIRVAFSHYQFETLHPFHGGNGRLGRLVMALQLMSAGELRFPVLNISPWLEQHRTEYQDGLLRVSQTGGWATGCASFPRPSMPRLWKSWSGWTSSWRSVRNFRRSCAEPKGSRSGSLTTCSVAP